MVVYGSLFGGMHPSSLDMDLWFQLFKFCYYVVDCQVYSQELDVFKVGTILPF